MTAVTFLLVNCKKHPFDYRNKFTGDFIFTESYHSFIYHLPPPNPPTDTLINYQYNVKIYVDYSKEFKGKVIFKMHDGTTYSYTQTVQVDKKYNLSVECPYEGQGTFANRDNLSYTASYNVNCSGAGLGGASNQSSHTIIGTRK